MKSRTSFFDRTVLKKDFTRFMPAWLLYLIGGLLIAISTALSERSSYSLAGFLGTSVGPFSVISLCYGLLTAQLLYGDLFSSRLCNALHAMPLRREGWFSTHFVAGLLFALVPNGVIALALMPFLGQFWFTALIWLLGMLLHYLFFFSLATLCMHLSGNRLAATALYGMINFLSPLAMWFGNAVYRPLLYGVVLPEEPFALLCPVWALGGEVEWFSVGHDPDCPCKNQYWPRDCLYRFEGWGEGWLYLGILAALGLVLAVVALVLYRRRQLECAGDFVAFRLVRPVFCVVYTLCFGAVLHLIGTMFDDKWYIFMSIGLIIGYFTGRMLLGRTLRVFRGRSWAGLALVFLLFFGSLGLCRLDVLGVVRYVPKQEEVASIRLSQRLVDNLTESRADLVLTEQEDIRQLRDIHTLLIAEGPTIDRNGRYDSLTVCYVLSDGREVYRQYRPSTGTEGATLLARLFLSRPEVVLGTNSLEDLVESTGEIWVGCYLLPGQSDGAKALLKALMTDCHEGRITSSMWPENGQLLGTVDFTIKAGGYGNYRYVSLNIWDTCEATAAFLRKELYSYVSAQQLAAEIEGVQFEDDYFSAMQLPITAFSELLLEQLQTGVVTIAPEKNGNMAIYSQKGHCVGYLCPKDSEIYAFANMFAQDGTKIESVRFGGEVINRDGVFPLNMLREYLLEELDRGTTAIVPEGDGNLSIHFNTEATISFRCPEEGKLYTFLQNWFSGDLDSDWMDGSIS